MAFPTPTTSMPGSLYPPGPAAAATGLERAHLALGVSVPGRCGDREGPVTAQTDLAKLLDEKRGDKIRLIILRDDKDLVGTLQVAGRPAKGR